MRKISFERTIDPVISDDNNEFVKIDQCDIMDRTTFEYVSYSINYDINNIIIDLLSSFSTNKTITYIDNHSISKIKAQFKLDFPRMDIYCNGSHYECIEQLESMVQYYDIYAHNIMGTLSNLLFMLSTQATFYYLYNVIHSIYNLPDYNIHVTSANSKPCIDIKCNVSSIEFTIKKVFNYVAIDSNTSYTEFDTSMIIIIDLITQPDGYIFYGNRYAQCKSAILHWTNNTNLIII